MARICLSPSQVPCLSPCTATFGVPEQTTMYSALAFLGAVHFWRGWSEGTALFSPPVTQPAGSWQAGKAIDVTYPSGDTAALLIWIYHLKNIDPTTSSSWNLLHPLQAARQHLGKIQPITTETRGWVNSCSPLTPQTAKALLSFSNLHWTGISGFLHRATCLFGHGLNLNSASLQDKNVLFLIMKFKKLAFDIFTERNLLICSKVLHRTWCLDASSCACAICVPVSRQAGYLT